MKKALIVALIAGTASTVTAAPRESVTFTAVNSVGWTNNGANETRTVTFAGSDAGGAYTARYLTIAGTVSPIAAGTFTREAVIEITPPGGQTFIAAPLNTFDSPTPVAIDAGRYVVPIGTFTTAGVWTFRFSELYDDDAVGPDQVWDTITFTLDDAPPPATVVPSPGVTVPFTDVNSDGALGAGNVVTTNVVAPGNINGIQIVGRLTMKTGSTIQNLNNGPFQARIRITPPASTGLAPFDVNPGVGGVSTGTANVSVSIPGAPAGGIPAAGLWTLEFWELEDEPTGVDAVWQNISFTFRNSTPPTATDFPALVDGGASVEESDFVTMAVPTAANTVTWLRVTVPTTISSGAGSAMDLDMVGSNGTPENDFNFGLYNSDGVRMANSFNTGPGLLPQVSL
ncbi:MAG TPA: hypothetical protein VFF65_04555, partial [Phycisphaerales bacterium]|nr:hypothetical protein [Phycisphaerales bacterium]